MPMPMPVNKTAVFLLMKCNLDFQAVYLHHNHILPGLFNICSRFNYNSPTGFSVFRINQSLHQPVPGQSAVTWVCVHHLHTPVGHVISETHRTRARVLGGLQGYARPSLEQLWQIQLDLGSGKCSRGLFSPSSVRTAVHRTACAHRCRLLWDMNHTIHCPRVTEGITPSQGLTMASKLGLSSGLAFTTWSGVLSSSESRRGCIWRCSGSGGGGITWRPQPSDLTHTNSDVTYCMNSSQVVTEQNNRFKRIVLLTNTI